MVPEGYRQLQRGSKGFRISKYSRGLQRVSDGYRGVKTGVRNLFDWESHRSQIFLNIFN